MKRLQCFALFPVINLPNYMISLNYLNYTGAVDRVFITQSGKDTF